MRYIVTNFGKGKSVPTKYGDMALGRHQTLVMDDNKPQNKHVLSRLKDAPNVKVEPDPNDIPAGQDLCKCGALKPKSSAVCMDCEDTKIKSEKWETMLQKNK